MRNEFKSSFIFLDFGCLITPAALVEHSLSYIELLLLKLVKHIRMGLFLGSLFGSIDKDVYSPPILHS